MATQIKTASNLLALKPANIKKAQWVECFLFGSSENTPCHVKRDG